MTKFVATLAVATVGFAPLVASAQSRRAIQNRQSQKSKWQDLGLAGAGVGILGLLSGNRTLAVAGLVGGAYSEYRANEDSKSKDRMLNQRAEMFSHQSITRNGQKYRRHTSWSGGKKYYQFVPSGRG